MNDEPPSSKPAEKNAGSLSWLNKLLPGTQKVARTRSELLQIIKKAARDEVVDQEALKYYRGALDVAHQQVREIMIPKSQMVCIEEEESPQEFLPKVIECGHSRFPVLGDSADDYKRYITGQGPSATRFKRL